MKNVFSLGVVQLLVAQGIAVEVVKQCLNTDLHVGPGIWIVCRGGGLIDQHSDARFKGLKPLSSPGLEQMSAAFKTFLTFQQCRDAPQMFLFLVLSQGVDLLWFVLVRQP